MKRILLLLFTVVVAVTSFSDITVETLAHKLNITIEDMHMCINNANVTEDDTVDLGQIIGNTIESLEPEDTASRKIGCFLACLSHKQGTMTGAHVNLDAYNNLLRSKLKGGKRDAEIFARYNRLLNTCSKTIENDNEECKVAFKFTMCIIKETLGKLIHRNNNIF